jgi:hypothetical protein
MATRTSLSRRLRRAPWLLAGTVVERYLKCCRKGCTICAKQGGHGPAYYLSLREDGRTRMVYIPKDHLAEVRQAIRNYHAVRDGLQDLTKRELQKWRKERSRQS